MFFCSTTEEQQAMSKNTCQTICISIDLEGGIKKISFVVQMW